MLRYLSAGIICSEKRDLPVCHMPITSEDVNWLPKSQCLSNYFKTFKYTLLQLKKNIIWGKVQYLSARKRDFNSVKDKMYFADMVTVLQNQRFQKNM